MQCVYVLFLIDVVAGKNSDCWHGDLSLAIVTWLLLKCPIFIIFLHYSLLETLLYVLDSLKMKLKCTWGTPSWVTSLPNPVIAFEDFIYSHWKFLHFQQFLWIFFSEQVVDSPTHKHGNVLDLILTDCAENITDLKVHPIEYQCISSDHNLITFNFYCEHNTSKTVPKETFNYI